MASTYTPSLHLEKPNGNDDISIQAINGNSDIIDDACTHKYISSSIIARPLDDEGVALSFESYGKLRQITFRGKGRAHTEDEVFLVIPEGHRPGGDRYFIGSIGGTGVVVRMQSTGNVSIYSINGATQGSVRLYCSLIWMVD